MAGSLYWAIQELLISVFACTNVYYVLARLVRCVRARLLARVDGGGGCECSRACALVRV